MALVKCPDCYEKVSDRAPTCPRCGCPINEVPSGGRRDRPQAVRVTEVQFTRKWVKLLGFLSFVAVWGGFFLQGEQPLVGSLVLVAGLVGCVMSSVAHWWLHA